MIHQESSSRQVANSGVWLENFKKRLESNNPSFLAENRKQKLKDLEQNLHKWVVQMRSVSIIVTGTALKAKAEELAEGLKVSNSWLQAFKERHGISGMWNYV